MPGQVPPLNFRTANGWTFPNEVGLPEFMADGMVMGSTGDNPAPMFLGKLAEFQSMRKTVWLDTVGAHAVYVMGKRRSGKSYSLGVLVEGLVSDGWVAQGARAPQAVVILDTMNVFLTAGAAAADVVAAQSPAEVELQRWQLPRGVPRFAFFHPAGTPGPIEIGSRPIGLRPTEVPLEDWYRFFELDPYADPIAHILSDAIERVQRTGYDNEAGVRIEPSANFSLRDLATCLRGCADFVRYDERTREASARRIDAMDRLGVFTEAAGRLDDLVQAGVASVLFLRDIDQSVRALFASVLARRLIDQRSVSERFERLGALAAAKALRLTGQAAVEAQAQAHELAAQAAAGFPRAWLVIDEAHNYLPNKGDPPSRRILKKLIDEGRNLGLSIVVATQQPSGLDPSIQRNADLLLVHSMTVKDDIDAAAGMLNTRVPESATFGQHSRFDTRVFEQVVRSLPRGYCLASADDAERVFPIQMRPRISYHGALEY